MYHDFHDIHQYISNFKIAHQNHWILLESPGIIRQKSTPNSPDLTRSRGTYILLSRDVPPFHPILGINCLPLNLPLHHPAPFNGYPCCKNLRPLDTRHWSGKEPTLMNNSVHVGCTGISRVQQELLKKNCISFFLISLVRWTCIIV